MIDATLFLVMISIRFYENRKKLKFRIFSYKYNTFFWTLNNNVKIRDGNFSLLSYYLLAIYFLFICN